MKFLKYLLVGIAFGIIMTKSEAISWYRIQEMFRFHSFHMYGIIGSALAVGIVLVAYLKKQQINTLDGNTLALHPKKNSFTRYLLGGIVFGLGWALSGACPGPMYTLLGNGVSVIIVVIASALLGTLSYGALRSKLPH